MKSFRQFLLTTPLLFLLACQSSASQKLPLGTWMGKLDGELTKIEIRADSLFLTLPFPSQGKETRAMNKYGPFRVTIKEVQFSPNRKNAGQIYFSNGKDKEAYLDYVYYPEYEAIHLDMFPSLVLFKKEKFASLLRQPKPDLGSREQFISFLQKANTLIEQINLQDKSFSFQQKTSRMLVEMGLNPYYELNALSKLYKTEYPDDFLIRRLLSSLIEKTLKFENEIESELLQAYIHSHYTKLHILEWHRDKNEALITRINETILTRGVNEKNRSINRRAEELIRETSKIIFSIDKIKVRLVEKNGGYDPKNYVRYPDRVIQAEKIMIGNPISSEGEAYALEKQLDQYIDYLYDTFGDFFKRPKGKTTANAPFPSLTKEKNIYESQKPLPFGMKPDFAHLYFKDKPVIANLSHLTEIQINILLYEREVLDKLFLSIYTSD